MWSWTGHTAVKYSYIMMSPDANGHGHSNSGSVRRLENAAA
jgi:hypothetical protein